MFDFVQQRKRIIQIILALVMLPFALWGIQSYRVSGNSDFVAAVGDQKISPEEFERALRDQRERLRQLLGSAYDPAMMENPEMRLAVLDRLIQQRLLLGEAVRTGLTVSDQQLIDVIQGIPAFRQDDKFSKQRYEALLRNQNLTPMVFEAQLRQELMVQQLSDAYLQENLVPNAVVDRLIRLTEQQREVSQAQIAPEQFLSQAKVDPAAVKSYYEGHASEFQVPEQVRLEYVALSADGLASQMQVSPDESKKYYEEHASDFGQPEERQASHILVSVPRNASEAEKQAARAKAEDLLKQVRQSPKSFAEIAKKYSQDTGSAASGGDLGFFARGAMVKPFDDAVFQMKVDEIRGPVETDFGYHIIKLTAIRPGKAAAFDDVKTKIEQEIRKQKAAKKFNEVAENFSNLVFEQGDSLKPAADAFKLPIQQSPWISRTGGQVSFPINDKMLQAVFSEDVLKNKRNTEAIEVAPNTLVSARVLEHKPAATRPFESVQDEIAKKLARQQAGEIALKQGKEKLEKLRQGQDAGVQWSNPQQVSRQRPQGLTEAAMRQIFKADVTRLPVYIGVETPQGGYTLFRVSKVLEASNIDDAKRAAFARQLRQFVGQEEFDAFVAGIRKKSEVKIRQEAVEKKQQ